MESNTLPQPHHQTVIDMLLKQGLTQQAKDYAKANGLEFGALQELEHIVSKFLTQNPACIELKRVVKLLAAHNDSVLIQGETGTGKELIAEALHASRKGKLVAVNCAGMPETLIESELFGHVQGAFTGANNTRPGLIEIAAGGTLFLDEIGDLPLGMQAKLLRVMQNKRVRKVGDKEEKEIDVRFVCATHFNLEQAVTDGKFRQDLYARISTFVLRIPPLRERPEDIPLLLKQYDKTGQLITLVKDWKGVYLPHNVRSLQAICRRYAILQEYPKV